VLSSYIVHKINYSSCCQSQPPEIRGIAPLYTAFQAGLARIKCGQTGRPQNVGTSQSMAGDDEDGFDINDTPEKRALRARLNELREEHRALDSAIFALQEQSGGDALQLARLKKRKLVLRDQIQWIEDRLTPDIIA
jgi:hypothetical protein